MAGEKTVLHLGKENDEGPSHSVLERWEDFHVKLLVSCWQKQKLQFGKGKATKKEIFNRIANEFNSISTDVKVTGEQCSRKWLKLEAAHKKITDHNNQTGADKKTWKYFDEMESCIGGNPNVRPKFTLESSSSSSTAADLANDDSEESEDDSEDEGSAAESSSSATKRKSKGSGSKRRKRKRKSKSSAAEMLSFLSTYADQREENEKEKVELMKEMKEERKSFFDKLLQVISKR